MIVNDQINMPWAIATKLNLWSFYSFMKIHSWFFLKWRVKNNKWFGKIIEWGVYISVKNYANLMSFLCIVT